MPQRKESDRINSMEYEIKQFTYKGEEKNEGTLIIYARDLETAEKIVAIDNTDYPWVWKRKIFGFCKKMVITIPPYEVELEQISNAEEKLKRRRALYKEFNITAKDIANGFSITEARKNRNK